MDSPIDNRQPTLREAPSDDAAMEAIRTARRASTLSGMIFRSLERMATDQGLEVRMDQGKYGCEVFHFGDEAALLQTHVEAGGLARVYTRLLDLKKPWWRAVLEQVHGGHLENVGLIAPSVYEALGAHGGKSVQERFRLSGLFRAAGIVTRDLGEEYAESELYGVHDVAFEQNLMERLQAFWQPLVDPDFRIEFSNGQGDLFRKLRLIPLTAQAKQSILEGGDPFASALQRIIDHHDQLIAHLRGDSR